MRISFIILLIFGAGNLFCQSSYYEIAEGTITFKSDAPLELIEAQSSVLKGIIDTEKNTFAFSVKTQTFEGFNTPLQKVHFNENYMESEKYPNCQFTGKIIEDVDLTVDGDYTIRAKGKLNVHGISQERIIKSDVTTKDSTITISAHFTVLLKEHNITIPKIVFQKIAEEIEVTIQATCAKK